LHAEEVRRGAMAKYRAYCKRVWITAAWVSTLTAQTSVYLI